MSREIMIGMPVFNGLPYVEAAVRSLLDQTHEALRLLISDDCSTDGTREICEALAKEDPRVTLVTQPERRGMVANFNRVLGGCLDAPFFMWAAQDDLWAPTFIEAGLEALAANEDAIGFMPTVDYVDAEGELLHRAPAPAGLSSARRTVRARTIGARGAWQASSAWNVMYGILRTAKLPPGFEMSDVPAPDIPVAFSLALAGPFETSSRALSTRRLVGYDRVPAADGSLVWQKALGPDGHLYSGAPGPRCRAMLSRARQAELNARDRFTVFGLIARWWWNWWRLRRATSIAAPRAAAAFDDRRWVAAIALGAEAAVLAPGLTFRSLRHRLGR